MRRSRLTRHVLYASVLASCLGGCAALNQGSSVASAEPLQPAVLEPDPAKVVEVVQTPVPLPLPGQLKPLPANYAPKPETADPAARVALANAAARVQPSRDGYINAVQVYPFADGALYQVYAAPGQVTDIALEEGETLAGTGPVAAGDTVRWVIGDTESGAGATKRAHILLKPTRADLKTNLVINTDRRTYHLELRATASTYMASVSWRYPVDQLVALRGQAAAADEAAPIASGIDVDRLNFGYRIDGARPPWRPTQVFDDGRQVFIEFPAGIAEGEMPPLFVLGPKGKDAELVNYRVRGRHMIVDRLFQVAELRLGGKGSEQRVRIERQGALAEAR
jgi:type IV secretion system protein VirB9